MKGIWVPERLDERKPSSFHLCLSLNCDMYEVEADVMLNCGILEIFY